MPVVLFLCHRWLIIPSIASYCSIILCEYVIVLWNSPLFQSNLFIVRKVISQQKLTKCTGDKIQAIIANWVPPSLYSGPQFVMGGLYCDIHAWILQEIFCLYITIILKYLGSFYGIFTTGSRLLMQIFWNYFLGLLREPGNAEICG